MNATSRTRSATGEARDGAAGPAAGAAREPAVGVAGRGEGTILDAIGDTPLVTMDGIWVKLEYLNPSGSIKARIAKYMIERAERDQGRSSPGSRSLPFFDRSGSVHAERSKQQGRLLPLFIFEMLTSTRRVRVSGFFVALTQRTHSQRAIGVISFHRF